VAQAKTCRKNVTNKKEFDRILRVCTKFANEKATKEELAAARYAARDAAWCAARDAAWCAARYTAWYAARDAARDAAWDAARDARYEKAVNMIIRMIKKEYDCRPSKEAA
jgi:hypothetical protein